jgi:enterochelin esterase-like enzyme
MAKLVSIIIAGVLIGCTGATDKGPIQPAGTSLNFQDFIDLLNNSSVEKRTALIDSFITAVSGTGAPLVEDTLAHFMYRGHTSSGVTVPGDFNGWDPDADRMTNVEDTDFYYRTKIFETDARLDYKFIINASQWILDPLNPNAVTGGFGPNSELAMGAYIPPEEIEVNPDIPHGAIESLTFRSAVLGNERRVQIYLPPGYEADTLQRYPSFYINDGGEYLSLASMNNVLDYLIERGDIGKLIAVFVDPVDRNSEYRLNESYKNMVIDELVPHVDMAFRTVDDPSMRGIMGASLGGLVSFFIAYHHPDVFGLCAGQSSAFYVDNNRMIDSLSSGPKKNILLYLDWGTYETSIRQSNLALLDVLHARGYSIETHEYHEGHSWGSWRAHTDDILRRFFRSSHD